MSIHSVHKSQDHLAWDNSIPPVLTVSSGSEVSFDCTDASNGQILPTSSLHDIKAFDFARLDQVNGPVFVEGAEPGDVLQVDVLDVQTADWGWTGLIPGFGLLADEYPEAELKIWKIETGMNGEGFAWFDEEKGIKIPISPFAGEMGVAPAEKGAFSTIPPYKTGVSSLLRGVSEADWK
jgi:acetamidase/formamidase